VRPETRLKRELRLVKFQAHKTYFRQQVVVAVEPRQLTQTPLVTAANLQLAESNPWLPSSIGLAAVMEK